jgi:hypothetical protein
MGLRTLDEEKLPLKFDWINPVFNGLIVSQKGNQGVYNAPFDRIVPLEFDTIFESNKTLSIDGKSRYFSGVFCVKKSRTLFWNNVFNTPPQELGDALESENTVAPTVEASLRPTDRTPGFSQGPSPKTRTTPKNISSNYPDLEEVTTFTDPGMGNLNRFRKGTQYGIIGPQGLPIIPAVYDSIFSLQYFGPGGQNLFEVVKSNKRGAINLKNEVILPLVYDELDRRPGLVHTRIGNKLGVWIPRHGPPRMLTKYDEIISNQDLRTLKLYIVRLNGRREFVGVNGVEFFRD